MGGDAHVGKVALEAADAAASVRIIQEEGLAGGQPRHFAVAQPLLAGWTLGISASVGQNAIRAFCQPLGGPAAVVLQEN